MGFGLTTCLELGYSYFMQCKLCEQKTKYCPYNKALLYSKARIDKFSNSYYVFSLTREDL